ncbi:hypothetical protein DCS_01547 [Drechmeria coniospora]|uniref:HTH APSES-type domain-containing protein n=1 Tax=Drechmeria coniospora TaxID=98403 RepID=A0A151GTK6_DRECN|nr:hypothetical protein DCS_01547 [Drechmeria coniospora]KYK60410.1 hypothetical protein DCS_01547 [Drechmeria coniospora]
MNQAADMYYSQHMSAGQAPPPQTVTSGAMAHYQHQQPPLLQPGPGQYSNQPQYNQYGYSNGLTSPSAAPPGSNPMAQPQNVLPLPGVPGQPNIGQPYTGFDTTGQHPPPGMKPRVTATLWEDEGSLCFQVEARGICVARREDNHMINGTKLLNVAGMTRGRRDGILKSEKVRHVVKIGPMHLKGVWIPYDRALDFANKEKITEMLYPLFVHNIGALLYHPSNSTRATQIMPTTDRRKEPAQVRNNTAGLPSLHHHHHGLGLPGPQSSHAPQTNMARPQLDRAPAFPTSSTGASAVMGSMGPSDSFGWQGQGMNGGQGKISLSARSLGAAISVLDVDCFPATTPPGSSMASMQSYPSGAQGYDGTRQLYNGAASQQSAYQNPTNGTQDRLYAQPSPYPKSEMGPPSSRTAVGGTHGDHHDGKQSNGIMHQEQAPQQQAGEDEVDHEHEAEYTHDSGAYDTSRTSYNYTAPGVGSLVSDGNMASDLTGSPSHPPSSGRATPRTAAPQSYYQQHQGYCTPPRLQSSSSLYNVMTNDRAPLNGAAGGDVYAPPADMTSSLANGYAAPVMNGSGGGMKRGRDDDDDLSRGGDAAGGLGGLDIKRRKTMLESAASAPAFDALSRPASAIATSARR